jgi:vacuolar protein sorting-associated protein 35
MIFKAADDCAFNAIAYEFLKEALLLYECEISESKAQVRALTNVVGTLLQCKHFPLEDYEALITKVAQYANKLLKKPDQCRMVSLCSHLFWPQLRAPNGPERFSDCDRVLECMQRALKIASVCDPNLFVELLDRYIFPLFKLI